MTARELRDAKKTAKIQSSIEKRRKDNRRSTMSSSRDLPSSPAKTRPSKNNPNVADLIARFGRNASPGKLPTTRPASASEHDVHNLHTSYPQNFCKIENPSEAPTPFGNPRPRE